MALQYKCEDGTALGGNPNATFELQCGFGGKYPANPDWVVCDITHCLNVTDFSDYVPVNPQYSRVRVGDKVPYSCADSSKLPGDQPAPFEVECLSDGTMNYPATFPTCRAVMSMGRPCSIEQWERARQTQSSPRGSTFVLLYSFIWCYLDSPSTAPVQGQE